MRLGNQRVVVVEGLSATIRNAADTAVEAVQRDAAASGDWKDFFPFDPINRDKICVINESILWRGHVGDPGHGASMIFKLLPTAAYAPMRYRL